MKKFFIMIPVFNDWESLAKLLYEINNSIQGIKNVDFSCFVINDASTISTPQIKRPSNIRLLKIINMKENRGHARCNAFGIRYFSKKNNFDHLIIMDGDGEDRPEEIKLLIKEALRDEKTSVVAKRIKRSEGFLFQSLYQLHKLTAIIFAGKNIDFGNYSCLTKNDVKLLSNKVSLWSSFSGSLKKHLLNFNSVNSTRGLRYFGPSKMSFIKLALHSLSIIAVFKINVFIRSAILIILLSYLSVFSSTLIISAQILLTVFNLLIFIVSLREKENELKSSQNNLSSIKDITH